MKVAITIDDVSRKSKLNINQPSIFTKKSYSYIILGFIQSYSGVLGEIEGFVQLIPGRYKSDNSVNITGIDKIHLKSDCFIGSIINGIRESTLYSYALDKPPAQNLYKKPGIKLSKKVNKSVPTHITFYLKADEHNAVDFKNETISFTCQPIKIK